MLKAAKYAPEKEWRLINCPDFDHAPLSLLQRGKKAVFPFPLSAVKEIKITEKGKYGISEISEFLQSIGLDKIHIGIENKLY